MTFLISLLPAAIFVVIGYFVIFSSTTVTWRSNVKDRTKSKRLRWPWVEGGRRPKRDLIIAERAAGSKGKE